MDKLKPCPFCAAKNLYVGNFNGPLEDGMTVYVRCLNCGATVEGEGMSEEEDTRRKWALEDAARRWNARLESVHILEALADIFPYAYEVYQNCGGDEENRGRAPRMRPEIKNAETVLRQLYWGDENVPES